MNTQKGNWGFKPLADTTETERYKEAERRRTLWILALSAITTVATSVIGLALTKIINESYAAESYFVTCYERSSKLL